MKYFFNIKNKKKRENKNIIYANEISASIRMRGDFPCRP